MDNNSSLFTDFRKFGKTVAPSIISLRRHFHRFPEIGHQEYATTARLKKEFKKLRLPIFDDGLQTGCWAELDTGKKGPVIAVRADIDALPIPETTGLSYASRNEGISHACGHDVHMAILIGVARILHKYKKQLCGKVKFLCQPAEEVPPGGARELIAAGVLKNPKVDAIVALHDDPTLPTGEIGIRDGITMAATFDFDVIVYGKPGHAALPHKALDAIVVASHIITALQQIVSRQVNPIDAVAISIGTIKGGTVRNGIADNVRFEGTARSLSPSITKKLPSLIKKTVTQIGKSFGAKVDFIPVADYPLFISDARVNTFISQSYQALYPRKKVHIIDQVLGGEDFACYLQEIPGAMFRLGVGNPKIGANKPWHHSGFIIDEQAIEIGCVTMAATVANMLFHWKGGRKACA